jgi:hypothetical protein
VHITAKILGHDSIATTQTYVAVYDQDVIEHHRAYITRRRALRPSQEYREPTDRSGMSSLDTSLNASSNSAHADVRMAPAANTNTPASAAQCSVPTPTSTNGSEASSTA